MSADRAATFERVLALEPGRTALLVVDMQRGFVEAGEAMEVPPARACVPVIRGLLDVFRAKRLPIVFTAFVYSPNVPLLSNTHERRPPAGFLPMICVPAERALPFSLRTYRPRRNALSSSQA